MQQIDIGACVQSVAELEQLFPTEPAAAVSRRRGTREHHKDPFDRLLVARLSLRVFLWSAAIPFWTSTHHPPMVTLLLACTNLACSAGRQRQLACLDGIRVMRHECTETLRGRCSRACTW
jgi:hypothetical protein